MAHHFDTDLARQNPRLNICDFYVFSGRPGFTTMVITTDGDALVSSSDTLHPEGIYAFRFDADGDGREDVVFKFRFGPPTISGRTSTAIARISPSIALPVRTAGT